MFFGHIVFHMVLDPRDRRTLFESTTFHRLREQIAAQLHADTLQRLVA